MNVSTGMQSRVVREKTAVIELTQKEKTQLEGALRWCRDCAPPGFIAEREFVQDLLKALSFMDLGEERSEP